MCERCARLEERVAWLESELGLQHEVTRLAKLVSAMGGRGARVVLALYAAKGRVLTREQIVERVPPRAGGEDDRNLRIIDSWVCRARQSLSASAASTIEGVHGVGYRLTDHGLAAVARILGDGAAA